MRDFADKETAERRLEDAKHDVDTYLRPMHPTDKATSYRAIETFAGEQAAKQEEANENDGVPERGQDG